MSYTMIEKHKRCLSCKKEVLIDYRESRAIMGKDFLIGYCPLCHELTDVTEYITDEHAKSA